MPTFSFRRPRFLRLHRSPSPSPSPNPTPAGIHDDSVASPSLHSSGHGVLKQDVNATPSGTSLSLVSSNPNDHLVDSAQDRSTGQASRPISQVGIVASHSVPTHNFNLSASQHSPHAAHFTLSRESLVPQHSPYPHPATSQQSLNFQYSIQPSVQYLQPPENQSPGMFNQAHDFTVAGTFIDNHITYNSNASNTFMKQLLKGTLRGAEFDSSARDPPPRCHPGTRLAILDRCLSFIHNCDGQKKIRWVVGAAGVGKSAIMQNIAETSELLTSSRASVFFSVNGRDDGTKTIITLSYQFAARSELYRELIEKEITRDPSLLQSSMAKQFSKFIIEPFIHNIHLNSAGRVLIIIDGLDECNNPRTQLDLLHFITNLCIEYPSSPLVWLIASRPETHITSFFSRGDVLVAYEKEEIPVDSDEGRADVERFLRDELMGIQKVSDSLDPQWPGEREFWKLANASGGLFAYAQTAMRYIGDWTIGSPASQLSDVLKVIDHHAMTGVPREEHPMASLDALYARILANVPSKIIVNTRKLLLALALKWDRRLYGGGNFIMLCNWLGMTADEAYAAVNHLRSVLYVPRSDKALRDNLRPFHKSFIDYVSDFTRSGFSRDIEHEARQLQTQCTLRVLEEAPGGVDFGDVNYDVLDGWLARGPGIGDNIVLTWSADEEQVDWNGNQRLDMYKFAVREVLAGMQRGDIALQSEFCIRLLTNRFQSYFRNFPFDELRNFVFHESRRSEFTMHGILKLVYIKDVDISQAVHNLPVKMRFRSASRTGANWRDPWRSGCEHEREGVWGVGKEEDWTTVFSRSNCDFCSEQLTHQLGECMRWSPEHCVLVLFSSTGECCVEIRFVDPEDDGSEWVYWIYCRISLEVRKKYGSIV